MKFFYNFETNENTVFVLMKEKTENVCCSEAAQNIKMSTSVAPIIAIYVTKKGSFQTKFNRWFFRWKFSPGPAAPYKLHIT